MQSNNSSDVEMELLSARLDQMKSWEIVRFALVTAARMFSISSCLVVINLVARHAAIRNKVNVLVVNLCAIICVHYVYATSYQFFRWKNDILQNETFLVISFVHYLIYIALITSITILPTFWFFFLTFRNLFQKYDFLILLGLLPPYLLPIIFATCFWNFNINNLQKFHYYFVLYYSINLLLILTIFIYFLMLKLEERLKKNKLDYLLFLGTSFSISLLPEILCFTFELYFFDEKGPLYYRVYYIDFGVDLCKYLAPLVVFSCLIFSNKYFRKACRKTFSRENFKRFFHRKNIEDMQEENMGTFNMKLDLNEVFL